MQQFDKPLFNIINQLYHISVMMFNVLFLFATAHFVTSTNVASQEDLSKLARANNNLAASIYPKLIKNNSDNVFFLPLSLMTGLGIMLDGAKGKTQEELYSALGYKAAGLPIDKIPSTYYYYLTEQLPQNNPHFPYYTLLCADEVLVTKKAPLNATFRKEAEHTYATKIENVNFAKTGHVTRNINNYVRQHTYGKINHIVNDVNSLSSAFLIDAVFFKGKWETPFPPYWAFPEKFHSTTGDKDVPFMLVIHSFPYYENDDFQALFLPYVGGFLGLLVLEPRQQNGLSDMEETMTPDKIIDVLNQLKKEKTLVLLPKFKFQYSRDFIKDFEELGAKSAFDGSADFSGMTSGKNLRVTDIIHKAGLEVDEANEGIGSSVDFSPPISKIFMADNPFMFAVVDIRYNLILAMGHVTDI